MLSCQDCDRYLLAFLDSALDVKESLDIQEHLRSCPICSNHADAERTVRAFVRQHAATPALPEDLKRRIIRQAMQSPSALPWWRRLGIAVHLRDFTIGVAAAAAVLLLVLGPFLSRSPGDDVVQKFVREASMTYGTYRTQRMPPEVESADDKLVTQWFNRRMGYPLKVPCITDKATKLVGGRLCRLLDRKSATMIYQRNGVELLLFAFKAGRISLPAKRMVRTKDRDFYMQSVAGRPVALWQHGGITYSIVGDMDPDDLLQVATTIDYR
jgi:anti-sigma factor (TIGR02949 family)